MKLCTTVQEGCGYKDTLHAYRYFAPLAKYFTVCITYQPPLVYIYIYIYMVAAQSKALICGRLPAEIVGSNPAGAWKFFCCECCVLSGRGIGNGLITRPEESYRLWYVVVCDLETSSRMRRPWPALGCSAIGGNIYIKIENGEILCKLCFLLCLHFYSKMG